LQIRHPWCGVGKGKGKAVIFLFTGNAQGAAAVRIAQAVFQ
jgi:hypothetical protein